MAEETTSEHIARDIREGRFPQKSAPQAGQPQPVYEGDYWQTAFSLAHELRQHLTMRPADDVGVLRRVISEVIDALEHLPENSWSEREYLLRLCRQAISPR